MTVSSAPPGIVLDQISKSYGQVRAVRSVNLTIAPGETVALLGPNGAGKSTTIDMVLGLSKPDSGKVSLFGMSSSEAVSSGAVGGMLQTGSLIPYLNVRELVTMVASLYPRPMTVSDVLRLTGCEEFAGRPTNKLSGGQTQRVRFAMALVGDPELLLLDEPTAALDVEGRRDFWASVRDIAASGKTVIFATHYLEEADAFADRIVLIARGSVVADGSATEIRSMASGKTIKATLPGVGSEQLSSIAGVTNTERHGDSVILICADSDAAIRELLAMFPKARDIEVRGAGLEEAFLALTSDEDRTLDELREAS